MSISEQDINGAFQQLIQAKQEAAKAADQVAMLKMELDKALDFRIIRNQINGRNEAERNAQARMLFPNEFAALTAAEATKRQAGLMLDLWQTEIERIQTVFRFLELGTVASQSTSAFR